MEIIFASKLSRESLRGSKNSGIKFIAFRNLSGPEIALAREFGARRLYLPEFEEKDAALFFSEFDKFWDELTSRFNPGHEFWRNSLSSKMQEWEFSLGYFCLVLFYLELKKRILDSRIILICGSYEMLEVCLAWARKNNISCKVNFKSGKYLSHLSQFFKNSFFFFARAGYILYKKLVLGCKPRQKVSTAAKKVLIASLFYESSFGQEGYDDPFFGRLHAWFKGMGHECAYLCESLSKPSFALGNKIRRCTEVMVRTPYELLSWPDMIKLLFIISTRRITFPPADFLGIDFSRLARHYSVSFEESFNFNSELYFSAVNKLCRIENFDRMLVTFEGNVHERACQQAFKLALPGKKIMGYSHGVIYPLNLKLRLSSREKFIRPEPDVFIGTGARSSRLLGEICGRPEEKIRPGCLLKKFIPKNEDSAPGSIKSDRITVVLDGMNSAAIFLDYLFENSFVFSPYKVILRFHPNIDKARCLARCVNFMPDNFSVSGNSLEDDIKESFCVLYRHSSVGIQATLCGVPAVHVSVDCPLSGDPIEGVGAYKWAAHTPRELDSIIRELFEMSAREKLEKLGLANDVLRGDFTGENSESFCSFIRS